MRVLLVGGSGALGTQVTKRFASLTAPSSWRIANLDLTPSKVIAAEGDGSQHRNVIVEPSKNDENLLHEVKDWLKDEKFDAIVHVAGGFGMGGIEDGVKPVETMWKMNALSAFTAAFIGTKCLDDKGLIVLTGAKAVYDGPTSFASGYGMSKAAVHHLAMDLKDRRLTNTQKVKCILPGVIDTPANRDAMPNEDPSTWTSPQSIADQIASWAIDPSSCDDDLFCSL